MKKSLGAISVACLPVLAASLLGAGAMLGAASKPAALTVPAANVAAADAWTVDAIHSSMVFRIKHMNTAWFYGRFNEISGSVNLDAADATKSALNIEVKTTSVDTANPQRDKHLRSSDFFNADQFPTCSFKSKSFSGSGNAFDVKGDLTINGVTKEITIKLEKTGEGDNPRGGGKLMGWETTFEINRQDYGIKYGGNSLGDEVRITVALETKK